VPSSGRICVVRAGRAFHSRSGLHCAIAPAERFGRRYLHGSLGARLEPHSEGNGVGRQRRMDLGHCGSIPCGRHSGRGHLARTPASLGRPQCHRCFALHLPQPQLRGLLGIASTRAASLDLLISEYRSRHILPGLNKRHRPWAAVRLTAPGAESDVTVGPIAGEDLRAYETNGSSAAVAMLRLSAASHGG